MMKRHHTITTKRRPQRAGAPRLKPGTPTVFIGFKLPLDLADWLDAYAVTRPEVTRGARPNRSAAARHLITFSLLRLQLQAAEANAKAGK